MQPPEVVKQHTKAQRARSEEPIAVPQACPRPTDGRACRPAPRQSTQLNCARRARQKRDSTQCGPETPSWHALLRYRLRYRYHKASPWDPTFRNYSTSPLTPASRPITTQRLYPLSSDLSPTPSPLPSQFSNALGRPRCSIVASGDRTSGSCALRVGRVV